MVKQHSHLHLFEDFGLGYIRESFPTEESNMKLSGHLKYVVLILGVGILVLGSAVLWNLARRERLEYERSKRDY